MTISDLMDILETDDLNKDFTPAELRDAICYIEAMEKEMYEHMDKEMRQFEPVLYEF